MDNLEIANVSTILDPFQCGEEAVLLAEFKLSLNAYLSELEISPVRSLADIIAFNNEHKTEVKTSFHSFSNSESNKAIYGRYIYINLNAGND